MRNNLTSQRDFCEKKNQKHFSLPDNSDGGDSNILYSNRDTH